MEALALIDGVTHALADARVAVTDDGVARGDGAFETIGVWDGRPFLVDVHLQRLVRSSLAIGLPAPDVDLLRAEITRLMDVAGSGDDGALRVYVTASGTRILTLTPLPPRASVRHLVPQPAPWIRPLGTYGPAGAKTMSYAPNMAAGRAARAAGGDDALLMALEGLVLEGPTFAVLWTHDGRTLHTPALNLGIVDSISRRVVVDAARRERLQVQEGHYPLDAVTGAREVLACSTVRDLMIVERIGDQTFAAGDTPVRDRLSAALSDARRGRS